MEPGGEPEGAGVMLIVVLAAGCLTGPAVALGLGSRGRDPAVTD